MTDDVQDDVDEALRAAPAPLPPRAAPAPIPPTASTMLPGGSDS